MRIGRGAHGKPIALVRTTALVPESTCTDLRRDLVAVPVVDAPVVSAVIAWRPESRARDLAALIGLAFSS